MKVTINIYNHLEEIEASPDILNMISIAFYESADYVSSRNFKQLAKLKTDIAAQIYNALDASRFFDEGEDDV